MTAHCAPRIETQAPPLVLLPGWGNDCQVFEPLCRALGAGVPVSCLELPPGTGTGAQGLARCLERLDDCVPRGAVLAGWSLGGALAIRYALERPGRLAGLVTLATNPCFCARPDWPQGMPAAEFEAFRDALRADPAMQLRRFAALQAQGDRARGEVMRQLCARPAPAEPEQLLRALDLLAELDLRAGLPRLDLPTLHVLGASDRLVPRALEAVYRQLQPGASVWVVEGTGHAPFLSRNGAVAARITDFLDTLRVAAPRPRRKDQVARSFARAAPGYDAAAALQRETGAELLALAPGDDARRVVDLGCGTGAAQPALAARYPRALVLGIDIAEGMLRQAGTTRRGDRLRWVGGDAESLPLARQSVDLVYSNLALQWCEAPARVFGELARVLRPGGAAVLNTLGPDTLWELRAAWRAVDAAVHVNRFRSLAELLRVARRCGLTPEQVKVAPRLRHYRSARAIAAELRALGAHNLNPGRMQGLAGRARWRQLEESYAELGAGDEGLPATWQVMHLVLRATGAPGHGAD